MRMRAFTAAAVSAAAVAGLVGTATAASAADEDTYANIYAAIDLPTFGSGPMEFEATDVLVGPGPELTGDDLIANPSDWCGDIEVDIDLDAMTITVTGGDSYCDFQEAYVAVELYGGVVLDTAELTEDTLFGGESYLQYYGIEDGVFDAYWAACDFSEEPVEGQPSPESSPEFCDAPDMDGLTSFVFSIVVDEEPVEEPVDEPVITPAPEAPADDVSDAEAAAPVVAQPTFTG